MAVAAAAAAVQEGALELHKPAVVLAGPCMRPEAGQGAEGNGAVVDAFALAVAAARHETAAAVAGVSSELLWPNPSLKCCPECPHGRFRL